MHFEPTEADRVLAAEVHRKFSARPGAQHIASEFALARLSALINRTAPKSVLEFGAGIGTITYLLLKHRLGIGRITTLEENPYCIDQFHSNVPPDFDGRYELLTDASKLDGRGDRFDLVVIDQALDPGLYRFLAEGTWCFVEGNRAHNREGMRRVLKARGLACDVINHPRGVRPIWLTLKKRDDARWRYPRIELGKLVKECWIGQVTKAARD